MTRFPDAEPTPDEWALYKNNKNNLLFIYFLNNLFKYNHDLIKY